MISETLRASFGIYVGGQDVAQTNDITQSHDNIASTSALVMCAQSQEVVIKQILGTGIDIKQYSIFSGKFVAAGKVADVIASISLIACVKIPF